MQRSVWRGAISFGLIYVPVEVMSASKDASLSLHFLDSRDFSPVGYQRINKSTGKEVDWAHIVKGYEYEKGHYVALSDADFKHANVKASETIEIANFTDVEQIPPMYYETLLSQPAERRTEGLFVTASGIAVDRQSGRWHVRDARATASRGDRAQRRSPHADHAALRQ
jgi:DNA end-binding protein Ku